MTGFDLQAALSEPWAVERRALERLVAAARDGSDPMAAVGGGNGRPSGRRSGRIAVVPISGLILPGAPDWAGTDPRSFRSELEAAVAASDVGAVIVPIDSPGGRTALMPETAEAIRAVRGIKPVVAIADTAMLSAAYWLGSQADEVVVTPSGSAGSVGVFMLHLDLSGANEQAGIEPSYVVAPGPRKIEGNPDSPLSDEARADWQREVDYIFGQFVDDVAEGRGVSASRVRSGFGGGRTLNAQRALEAGLVDRIASFESTVRRLLAGGTSSRDARAAAPVRAAAAAASATARRRPSATRSASVATPPAAEHGEERPPSAEDRRAFLDAMVSPTRSTPSTKENKEMPSTTARRRSADTTPPRRAVADGWRVSLSSETKDNLRGIARHQPGRPRDVSFGEVIGRDAFAADVTGTAGGRRGEYAGVAAGRRRFRLLELLPTGTTDGNVVPFTQESGAFTAAETADGSAAPEDEGAYTDGEAPVRYIATTRRVVRQAIDDSQRLNDAIDGRLRYAVLKRLEGQIIAGNGVGQNLLGILNTSGIGSITTGTSILERLLAGIEAVAAAADPDAIVVSWSDWPYVVSPDTASLPAPAWFETEPIPVIPSIVMPAGTALVGSFEMGAELVLRTGVGVALSVTDRDNLTTNRATLRAGLRAALPVWVPSAFAAVDLDLS